MRSVRRLDLPEYDDINDPATKRDKLYCELRTIGDLAQKLSDRVNRAAVRLASLPIQIDAEETE